MLDANPVQLILEVLPQTAVESDAKAVQPLLETLEQKGRLPETMLADTIYGSDENVVAAAIKGVELVSPVPGGHTTDATAAPHRDRRCTQSPVDRRLRGG